MDEVTRKTLYDAVIAIYALEQDDVRNKNLMLNDLSEIQKVSQHIMDDLDADGDKPLQISISIAEELFGNDAIAKMAKHFAWAQMDEDQIKQHVRFYRRNSWPQLSIYVGDVCYWDRSEWDDRRGEWIHHW